MAFHAPQLLSPDERDQFEVWQRSRWSAVDAPETEWMTLGKSLCAIAEMRASDRVDASLVSEIEVYLHEFET